MRRISIIKNREEAQRFVDYLLTHDIAAEAEEDEGGWAVWIQEEDHVQQAREELGAFQADMDHPRYRDASMEASRIRKASEKKEREILDKQYQVRRRWERPALNQQPVTLALIAICIVVGVASRLGSQLEPVVSALTISDLSLDEQGHLWQATGFTSVAKGEIWRLITPIFIHFSAMHLLFNMYWLYILGGLIESRRGSLRFLALVLELALVSTVFSYTISQHALSGGMSGVGYGLLGYAWMKSRYDPKVSIYIPPNIVVLFIVWFFLCIMPATQSLLGNIDNYAHGSGLVLGLVIGYAPRLLRRIKED